MEDENKPIVVDCVVTETKFFFVEPSGHKCLYYDGEQAEKTYKADYDHTWLWTPKKPEKVIRKEHQPNINYRFELIDLSMKNRKFPAVIKAENRDSGDGYKAWMLPEGKEHLSSLYAEKSDKQPELKIPVNIEWNLLMRIPELDADPEFAFKALQEGSFKKVQYVVTAGKIKNHPLDELLFPPPVLQKRPSCLSSKETFDIIRHHIRENINPKVAIITSDYDFCFTVKRKVRLAEAYINRYEHTTARGKSYRPPRFSVKKIEEKQIEIFEMTHTERDQGGYQGYTPIAPFRGCNIDNLKKNIETYLEDLMAEINRPLTECGECAGSGIVDWKRKAEPIRNDEKYKDETEGAASKVEDGETADALLSGEACQICGQFFEDGEEPGYPRTCGGCE